MRGRSIKFRRAISSNAGEGMDARKCLLVIPAIVMLLCSPANAVDIDRSLPMQLEKHTTDHFDAGWTNFFIVDVNNDGDDDLLIDRPLGLILMKLTRGQLGHIDEIQYPSTGNGSISHIEDVTGDGTPEFFVQHETSDGIRIECYHWLPNRNESELLYSLAPVLKPTGSENAYGTGSAIIGQCFDADSDGELELYQFLTPHQAWPYPRSLRAYDALSGQYLREFTLGPKLADCQLFRDKNRGNRIIVTTSAPQNHATWNDTSDSLSYIFCLNPDLTLAWKRIMTVNGGSCLAALGDVNCDGTEEILVTRCFANEILSIQATGSDWSVAILDPYRGTMMNGRPLYTGTDYPFLENLSGDARLEVIVRGQNNKLYIMDHELNLLTETADRSHEMIHFIADLDRNGSKEIVCSGEGLLMVRDARGGLKAEIAWNNVIGTRTYPKVEIAEIAEQIYLAAINDGNISLFRYAPSPLRTRIPGYILKLQTSTSGAAVLVAAGVIAGATGTILAGFRRRKPSSDEEQQYSVRAGEDLLNAMAAYGHSGSSIKIINRLRFFLKNWDRAAARGNAGRDTFDRLAATYSESVLPELRSIASLAQKAGAPQKCWREMARCAEHAARLLPGLSKSATLGREADDGPDTRAVLESLDAVDRSITGVKKHLRSIFHCPVAGTAIRIVSQCAEEFSRLGVEPIVAFSGTGDQHAFISTVVLERILENMIANSLRAMETSAVPQLRISIAGEGDHIVIDITDSGCGIPADSFESVFDRQYTTKPEGGFGLHYAREEIARFGGKIFVTKSDPYAETAFRILLRRS
ncbi:MAG: ATP-binding protein [Candidatus Krumholzibacteria bacterium]|nr:ATP-binding protein [Candidatus Krumholzibacteria bacterium]